MATCPKCKEELPLLSKICPVCGYVVEGDQNAPHANDFADALEKCLYQLKSIPLPSFMRSMAQLSFVMLPLIAVYMLMLAIVSSAGLFWVLFVLFAVLSLWVIVKKLSGKLGNDLFNRQFKEIKNEYEYHERTAKRNFGKSKEVTKLINDISSEISRIEEERNAVRRKNLFIWLVILIVFFVSGGLSIFSVDKALNEENTIVGETDKAVTPESGKNQTAQWREAMENFKNSPDYQDEYKCNEEAIKVISMILSAGEEEEAENFFLESCMGKVGDMACAMLFVEHYKTAGKLEIAKIFVDRCTGLRYKSDKKKLEKLLK